MSNETSTFQKVKLCVDKANLYYELGDYKSKLVKFKWLIYLTPFFSDVLLDLEFINKQNMMTNSLKVMKW